MNKKYVDDHPEEARMLHCIIANGWLPYLCGLAAGETEEKPFAPSQNKFECLSQWWFVEYLKNDTWNNQLLSTSTTLRVMAKQNTTYFYTKRFYCFTS